MMDPAFYYFLTGGIIVLTLYYEIQNEIRRSEKVILEALRQGR